MEYSNSEIPEGINTTDEHPLKEFFILSAGIIGLIAAIVLFLSFSATLLAPHIPFSFEKELAGKFITAEPENSETNNYLQSLMIGLRPLMDLPEDMEITLHYVNDDTENAFATLGGHIFIHRGLIDLLPNENALSMVIAHEIAHVKHRHPVIAMGRGVVIGLFLSAVTGISGDRFVGGLISNTGTITILGFSRKQESEADRSALKAVNSYYGHINGTTDLFRTLKKIGENQLIKNPQFLSTHPLGDERIKAIEKYARDQNWDQTAKTAEIKRPDIQDE